MGRSTSARGGCSITVNAGVTFAGNVGNGAQNVFVRLRTWDPAAGAWVLGPQTSLHRPGTAGCPNTAPNIFWCGDPTIADQSGNSELVIEWSQTAQSVGGTACSNQTPCTGSFGVQAQSFGACNGCNQPDDSGPIVFSRISEVANAAGAHHSATTRTASPAARRTTSSSRSSSPASTRPHPRTHRPSCASRTRPTIRPGSSTAGKATEGTTTLRSSTTAAVPAIRWSPE